MSDRRHPSDPPPAAREPREEAPPEPTAEEPGEAPAEEPVGEPVELEITDVLDLHSFPPREVKPLVRDYLDLAAEKGLAALRIVHGRGTGVQRRIVRSLLARHPRVRAWGDAPAEAGGWGATWVELAEAAEQPGGGAAGEPGSDGAPQPTPESEEER